MCKSIFELPSTTLRNERASLMTQSKYRPDVFPRHETAQSSDSQFSSSTSTLLTDISGSQTPLFSFSTIFTPTMTETAPTSGSTLPATPQTSFSILSPVYLGILVPFVFFLILMIWLLMVPNPRRPWSCRSHRRRQLQSILLRTRGPGDAYKIEPNMWRGGGRVRGEDLYKRGRLSALFGGRDDQSGLVGDAGAMAGTEGRESLQGRVRLADDAKREAPLPPPLVYIAERQTHKSS